MAIYSGAPQSVFVLIALLVCLIPTTIGGLLSAIGIAGMDRVVQRNVLAMSGRAVEAAGDVDTLLLDKTGTITLGNRRATEFIAAPGVSEDELADAAQLASLADETPEGRSIVVLAKEKYGLRGTRACIGGDELHSIFRDDANVRRGYGRARNSQRRVGRDREICKAESGNTVPHGSGRAVKAISDAGGTPLLVAEDRADSGHDSSEGYREGRNARAVRPAARDGNSHGDDYGRQSADGGGNCARSGRGRFSGAGKTGRQAGV